MPQQEAARYLETYKAYEQKSAESIQEKVGRMKSSLSGQVSVADKRLRAPC